MIDNLTMSVCQTLEQAQGIFEKKFLDYGTNWREYSIVGVGDQLYIKTKRIGKISNGIQMINGQGDDIASEFIGIINYSVMGIIQNRLGNRIPGEKSMTLEEVMGHYTGAIDQFKNYLKSQHSYLIEQIQGFNIKKLSEIFGEKAQKIKGLGLNKDEGNKIIILGAFLEIIFWVVIGYENYKATQ